MLGVRPEPVLGTNHEVEHLGCLFVSLQCGLSFLVPHPRHSADAVAIDLHVPAVLLDEREGMNDGKELTDVVRALYRTEVEEALLVAKIDALILHSTRIATATCIDRNGVEIDLAL